MIGKTISHYKILEKLGEGGMGVVYKAEDTKLDRTVALKFLTQQALGGDEDRERFIHEAKSAAALPHPNICTVHEIDEAEGQTFIAMEYVEGQSLKEKIESNPLKLHEALILVEQVAEGLQEAHEKGIVHRDIKPANLMITSKGQVKIMDFGLAKSAKGTALTQAGTTLGTIAYMSPEQTRAEDVDARTDIWSLGAVLYEMLTGQRSFKGDYEQAVVYSILNAAPEPVTALRTGLPMDLERIIDKCLAKNVKERYQTAADLVADLRRLRRSILDGASAPRVASPQPEAYAKRTRRWPLIVAAIAVAAVAYVVLRPYFAQRQDEAPQESLAEPTPDRQMLVVLPFENLGPAENAYFADGMTEEITSRIASVKALGVISRTTATQYDRTGKTLSQIGEDLGVDYVLEGTVRWDGIVAGGSRVRVTPQLIRVSDDTHVWADVYERRLEDIFSVQSDVAEKVVGQLGITLLEPERGAIQQRPTDNLDAYNAYLRGMEHYRTADWLRDDLKISEQMFERALEIDPAFALASAELSINHTMMYWAGYDRTEERLAKALAAALRALELQPALPEAHLAMGYYYYWGHLQYEEALREFAIAEEGLPNDARILEAIAYVRRRQGHFEEAVALLREALELSPRDSNVALSIADTYTALREYAEADRFYKRSISIVPDQATAYCFRANNFWLWKGDVRASRETLETMPVMDDIHSPQMWHEQELLERDYEAALERLWRWNVDFTMSVLDYYSPPPSLAGRVYDYMGEPDLANAMYDSARVMLEGLLETGPEDHSIHVCLGLTYAGLGRRADAIREARLAVELNSVSMDAYSGPFVVLALAEVYVMLRDYDAAMDELEYLMSIPSEISVPVLRLHPKWDPLRDHPRFQRLLEKYAKPGS